MATINQLVRKPRKRKVAKSDVPALQGLPAASRCLHPCIHHYPEEAELGTAQGLSCASDQRLRGFFVHRW
jgi:hypothetical protein